MWALGFTLNSVTMLALVLMVGIVIDDAIVVLENIFRFVEEKGMHAVRGGARRRPPRSGCRAGDDAEPGGHLRAGLVHVEHRRAASSTSSASPRRSRFWSACRVVHAHADDERAAPAGGRVARRTGARLARGLLRASSTGSTCGMLAWAMRQRGSVMLVAGGGRRDGRAALRTACAQEFIPCDVDEAEFDMQRHGVRGDEPRRDGRGRCDAVEARGQRDAAACARCSRPSGGGFLGR